MAFGILLSLLIMLPTYYKYLFKIYNKNYLYASIILYLFTLIIIIIDGNSLNNLLKPSLSFILIISIIFLTNGLFKSLLSINIKKSLIVNFVLLTLIGILGVLNLQPPLEVAYNKLVFPFQEPSHFAIAYGPISLSLFIIMPSLRIFILFITLAFTFLFPSVIFSVLVILQVALLPLKYLLGLFVPVIIFGSYFFSSNFQYFSDRLGRNDRNATFLTYKHGWESISSTILDPKIFGVGFQNMGINSTTKTGSFLCEKYFFCSNKYDGSFLASKLITEFGFLGLIFSCVLIAYFIIAFLNMKFFLNGSNFIKSYDDKFLVNFLFKNAIIYSFLIELFFRGYGYFSTGLLMFIFCLFNIQLIRPKVTF